MSGRSLEERKSGTYTSAYIYTAERRAFRQGIAYIGGTAGIGRELEQRLDTQCSGIYAGWLRDTLGIR